MQFYMECNQAQINLELLLWKNFVVEKLPPPKKKKKKSLFICEGFSFLP